MTKPITVHVYPQAHTPSNYRHLNPNQRLPIPMDELQLIVSNQHQIAGEVLKHSQKSHYYFEEGRTTNEWSLLFYMDFLHWMSGSESNRLFPNGYVADGAKLSSEQLLTFYPTAF